MHLALPLAALHSLSKVVRLALRHCQEELCRQAHLVHLRERAVLLPLA